MRIRVKIYCISSFEEAALAVSCGADALGLVGAMPGGPGVISDELITSIATSIPPAVGSFLLTCAQTPKGIIEHVKKAGTNTVQIVDELLEGDYEQNKSCASIP
jgi:phosphoribosylanthranilate isomerase